MNRIESLTSSHSFRILFFSSQAPKGRIPVTVNYPPPVSLREQGRA